MLGILRRFPPLPCLTTWCIFSQQLFTTDYPHRTYEPTILMLPQKRAIFKSASEDNQRKPMPVINQIQYLSYTYIYNFYCIEISMLYVIAYFLTTRVAMALTPEA